MSASDHKHVILVVNDDLAQWSLGSYGNDEIRAPTLDYLAATGVLMENAFTPTPVCSPARASLLTGRLASQHGIHDYLSSTIPEIHRRPWLEDELTLAQLLAEAGYQTAHCGKWHLGNDDQPQAGFSHWFSGVGDYPAEHGGDHRFSLNGEIQTIPGQRTQVITDKAIEFLRQRDTTSPFFLHIGYFGTHNPWRGQPERLVAQYRQNDFDGMLDQPAYPFGIQALESTLPTRLNPREALAQYFAAVSHIDEAMGRLLDEMEALKLRDQALIVFTSDHGLCCGHHGLWGKGNATLPLNMLEEAIRVPLIINHPQALFAGQRRSEFVDHLDIFQTIAEYTGVLDKLDAGRKYPGRSFLPLLDNSAALPDWRRIQFGEYGDLRMARRRQHKLLRRYDEGASCELFDLFDDPTESHNRYDDPAYQPVVEDLTGELESYFGRYQDDRKSGLRVRELPKHNLSEAWRLTSASPGTGKPVD
ncbi:MAG: sulfatase-like hydrolase/transferase [Chloroflexi bacterium]|nr:sulfatase-like hydrolase/transferase [Chloroflexota bacterium]